MNRPNETEYAPDFQGYVDQVSENDIMAVLRGELDELDVLQRGEKQNLPGFDQNDYMLTAPYKQIELEDLLSELRLVRLSNIAMFRSLDEESWNRVGTANGNEITVRALAFIMGGHLRHHMNVLRERYLSNT